MSEFSERHLDAKLATPGDLAPPLGAGMDGRDAIEIRARAVELAALSFKSTVPPVGDIVRSADVIYNYLLMGTIPPKPAGKEGSSFQNKGGRE